jgi:hypothetical protein
VIVYIESNFVLEMALEQEEVSSSVALLDLAEDKKITLATRIKMIEKPSICTCWCLSSRKMLCQSDIIMNTSRPLWPRPAI